MPLCSLITDRCQRRRQEARRGAATCRRWKCGMVLSAALSAYIRAPTTQGKLREPRRRARSACFVLCAVCFVLCASPPSHVHDAARGASCEWAQQSLVWSVWHYHHVETEYTFPAKPCSVCHEADHLVKKSAKHVQMVSKSGRICREIRPSVHKTGKNCSDGARP